VRLALAEFPQLTEEFAENDGLLHLQMAALSRFAQTSIECNDLETLQHCYSFIAEVMKTAAFDGKNAVYVSFLENLEFASSPYDESARRLLPPSLEKMLSELEDHFQKLYEWQVEAQDNQQRP
jgi:hypothetical protein